MFGVRPLQPGDRVEWELLWAAYNAFYGREGNAALSEKTVATAWRRLLDDREDVHGLVAVDAGRLVGLTHFIFHRNMIQPSDTCYMQDLFTAPEARGCGVARKLVANVVEVSRQRGVAGVYCHTHSTNEPARALYDRLARNTGFLVYRIDRG